MQASEQPGLLHARFASFLEGWHWPWLQCSAPRSLWTLPWTLTGGQTGQHPPSQALAYSERVTDGSTARSKNLDEKLSLSHTEG